MHAHTHTAVGFFNGDLQVCSSKVFPVHEVQKLKLSGNFQFYMNKNTFTFIFTVKDCQRHAGPVSTQSKKVMDFKDLFDIRDGYWC